MQRMQLLLMLLMQRLQLQVCAKRALGWQQKHVTVSYKAGVRVGNGSSLVNFETQGCADGNAVVLVPQTLPAVSLHAAIGISRLVLTKLICLVPGAESFC